MARPKGSKNKTKGGPKAGKETAKSGRKKFVAPVSGKGGDAADKPRPGAIPPGTTVLQAITSKVTPAATLKSLLSDVRGLTKNVDEIVGSLREKLAFAKAKKNLNTKAFAELRKYDKMEPEKAAEYHHTVIRYLELTGIMAKIDSVGRLPLGDDAPEAGEAGEGGQAETETEETETDGETAEAAQHAAGQNGAGGAPEPETQAGGPESGAVVGNVTRPRFGQMSVPKSQSQKAEEARLAAAGGKPH